MSDLDPADGIGDESSVSDGSGVDTEPSAEGGSDGDLRDRAVEAAADEVDIDREELLKRAIVGLAESEGIAVPDAAEVESIRTRLDELDADVDERVTDLRERFVTLYQDLESKASADHVHGETVDRLDSVEAGLDDVATELDSMEGDLDAAAADLTGVEDRLANLESQVGDLDVGEVEDKLSRVASAVVRARRRLETLEGERDDRGRIEALTAAANRHGVETAACGDCGETVSLGLLRAPECPHCGRGFVDIEPKTWFFGSSRLVVNEPPALDGDVGGARSDDTDGPGDARTDARRDRGGGR
ncbi:hypothetical protein [Halorubrum pallidum]